MINKNTNIKQLNKPTLVIGIIAIAMLMTAIFFNFFIISRDISLPYSLWVIGTAKTEYGKNSYIMTSINDPRLTAYDYIIKKVTCISGETLTVRTTSISKHKKIFCNDQYIGEILDKDRNGNELKSFMSSAELTIPAGYYFLSGTHKRSYDSRYFGLINNDDIILTVYPIL